MNSTAAPLLPGLKRNLTAGLRLAAFLPVSRYDSGDFVLLWTFNLLALFAFSGARLHARPLRRIVGPHLH